MKGTFHSALAVIVAISVLGCSKPADSDPATTVNRIEQVQNDPSIPAGVKEDVIRRIKKEEGQK